jgi:acetolactate synthase regulatory subunit
MIASAQRNGCVPADGAAPFRFRVRALPDPQAMLRIVGLIAQRGLLPNRVCCRKSDPHLVVEVELELESSATAQLLLEKIRSLVLVDSASLTGWNP